MKETDFSILKVLNTAELPIQAGTIMWYINNKTDFEDVTRSTFYRRLNRIEYADLADSVDDRFYTITELGERLLAEDLSDEEVAEVSQRLQEGPPDEN